MVYAIAVRLWFRLFRYHRNVRQIAKLANEEERVVISKEFEKHGEIVKLLKEQYKFTHGFAKLVAHKSKETDSASAENKDDLIDAQYK